MSHYVDNQVRRAARGGGRLAGGSRAGGSLAGRYLALRIDEPAAGGAAARTIAHALLNLPLSLGSLALGGYLWLIVPANLAYPLRPGTMDSYQHSSGGPSLAGAWAVHAAGGLAFLWVAPWFAWLVAPDRREWQSLATMLVACGTALVVADIVRGRDETRRRLVEQEQIRSATRSTPAASCSRNARGSPGSCTTLSPTIGR